MRSAAEDAGNMGIAGNVVIIIFPIPKSRAIAVFS